MLLLQLNYVVDQLSRRQTSRHKLEGKSMKPAQFILPYL